MARKLLLVQLLLVLLLIMNIIPRAKAEQVVTFRFNELAPDTTNLTLQGTAKILPGGTLALTRHSKKNISFGNIGRVMFHAPLTNVKRFDTSLNFTIKDIRKGDVLRGDGLVLFIASSIDIPVNSGGGNLGVSMNMTWWGNEFVGVEFDSYSNHEWDPPAPHIGIDQGSVQSLTTVDWNRSSGAWVQAHISYSEYGFLSAHVVDSIGHVYDILPVSVGGDPEDKQVIPSTYVGISATTGAGRQTHDIHSWTFTAYTL